MSPLFARVPTTGIGPPAAKRPPGGRVPPALGVRSQASSASARTTATITSTRRVVKVWVVTSGPGAAFGCRKRFSSFMS